jgi:hypothetical protein
MIDAKRYKEQLVKPAVLLALLAFGVGAWLVLLDDAPWIALSALLLLLFIIAFVKYPKETLIGFGLFLLLQDLLVGALSAWSSPLSLVLKRADEVGIAVMFTVTFLQRGFLRLPIYWPLTSLALVGILSTLRAEAPLWPAVLDLFLMLKGFLLFIIAAHLRYTEDDLRKLCYVFGGIGCLIFLIGLVDFFAPPWQELVNLARNVQYRAGLRSAQAIFSHPGVFGQVMAFLLLYALAFFALLKKRPALVFSGLFGLGVLLSLRLRPLLSISATILLGLVLLRGKYLSRAIPTFVVLGCLAFFVFLEPLAQVLALKVEELEEGARLVMTKTSWLIARDYFPLGSGLGTFGGWISRLFYSSVYSQYGLDRVFGLSPEVLEGQDFLMDTYWPYVLGETGALGLLFYILALLYIGKSLYRIIGHPVSPLQQALALGALLALIEATIEGFASSGFQTSLISYCTLFVAGVIYGSYNRAHY